MRVEIINVSHHKPLGFIGECAGISHGKTDASIKRALGCWRAGHTSVLEHVAMTFRIDGISRACSHQLVRHRLASFVQESQRYLGCWRAGHTSVLEHVAMTFRIDGISRACSHQLVRHRLASFVQESQRYTKIDVWHGDWYVIPPTIEQNEGLCKQYKDHMADAGRAYDKALYHGIKPEDARYLLPEATKTSVVMTTNLRELEAFYKLRSDKAAQWEIRELGIKPEDARYLLPEATKTSVVMTTNLRELEAFYKLRSDKAAQWEIRELACSMLEAVGKLDYEWQTIADMIYQHAIEG